MEDGPEDLALELTEALDAIEPGGEKGPKAGLLPQRAPIKEGAVPRHARAMGLERLPGAFVDHRADVGLYQAGIADDELGHGAGQHLHDTGDDVLLDEQDPE